MKEAYSMSIKSWYDELALEIELISPEDFLKIKETLTRMGIPSYSTSGGKNKLFQTCHIFQKRGLYYICHFKELLLLDGKQVNLSDEDIFRRNLIVSLLQEWGMIKLSPIKDDWLNNEAKKGGSLCIVTYKDSLDWDLHPKYTFGGRKNN